jgi:hypothetical protein
MKLGFCVACGSADDLQHHHLVTRAEGGSNDETNLITLCCGCHLKLHQRQQLGGLNAKSVAARDEAKARAQALRPILAGLTGKSARAIAAELNARNVATPNGGTWSGKTVIRVQKRLAD